MYSVCASRTAPRECNGGMVLGTIYQNRLGCYTGTTRWRNSTCTLTLVSNSENALFETKNAGKHEDVGQFSVRMTQSASLRTGSNRNGLRKDWLGLRTHGENRK